MRSFYYILIFCLGFNAYVQAQANIKFGLRAGINIGTMFGEKEKDAAGTTLETFSPRTRIAVGATMRVKLAERFGFGTELMFVQKGAYTRYEGISYLIVPNLANQTYEGHKRILAMNLTNGYLQLPVFFYADIIKKRLQIDVGITPSILVSSRGIGVLKYIDPDSPTELVEYDVDAKYLKDTIGQIRIATTSTGQPRLGRVDGSSVPHPYSIGGYYFNTGTKSGNMYKTFDLSASLGMSFYFTEGLRLGFRAEYGLLDVSNNIYDVSNYKLDANRKPVARKDFDRNFGVQLFIGLQF